MTPIIGRINDYPEMGGAHTATPAEGLRELRSTILRTQKPTLAVLLNEIFV